VTHVQLFLSTVSAEFRSYRDALRRPLTRPNVSVAVQEDFIPTGTETLDKLDDYIQACHAVIHLVGDMTGALAHPSAVASIHVRYPDLDERVPPLRPFLVTGASPLSYTQWEAYLAIYHRKTLIIATPDISAVRDARYVLDRVQQRAQQDHLRRLRESGRHPEINFASEDKLAIEILRSGLHDILVAAEVSGKPGRPPPREAPLPPESFTARDDLVRNVVVLVCADDGEPVTVLCGMGGVGKTTLAAACTTAPAIEARFADGTFWVDLQSSDPLDTLARIADAYEQDVSGCVTAESRAAAVRSVLSTKHALFVLDDAWRFDDVKRLLPSTRNCRVLVTTRDEALANEISAKVIPIDTLDPTGSADLWRRLVGDSAEKSRDLDELLDLLGGLPLALTLAGTRARKDLRRGPLRLADYVEELRRPATALSAGSRYERVGAAFRATYDRALDADDRSRFRALVTLGQDELHLTAVARLWALDVAVARRQIEVLADLSLVGLEPDGRCHLHPLVRGFAEGLLAQDSDAVRRELHERASDYFFDVAHQSSLAPDSLAALDAAVSSYVHATAAESKERCARVVPDFRGRHLRRTLIELGRGRSLVRMNTADFDVAESKGVIEKAWARYWLADALYTAREAQRCEQELRSCLDEATECSGQRPLLIRRAAFLLGHVLRDDGRLSDAAQSYEQAMVADCELSGKTIDPLALLQIGDCYAEAGELEKARDAFQRAYEFAMQASEARSFMPVRALVRFGELYASNSPGDALRYLDLAASYDQPLSGEPTAWSLFSDGDGASYMNRIACAYANLALKTPIRSEGKAARCFRRALAMAGTRPVVHADALQSLGALLEQLDAIPPRTPDLPAAVACQVRAAQLLNTVEHSLKNPPDKVLDQRLRARMSPADFEKAVADASQRADEIIEAALVRLDRDVV
jgi:tetratricopeptide (TPR) repeat protein